MWEKPTARPSWGDERAEWEATAQRQADAEQARRAASASRDVRVQIQEEMAATKKQRRRATSAQEYGRQLDRQREEIHPPRVLEALATLQPPALSSLRLPEAKPDPDREYPGQILPIRPYERENDAMSRMALPLFEGFIETPFEQRFQGLLRQAWKLRRWQVIVAEPGSGKTMGIRDLSAQASREAGMIGGRRYPVLAVTTPKNDPKEAALGNFLLTALGLGARGRWSERKYLVFDLLVQYGVECLVFDDAHDLSMPHLIFLKELTDQLQ
jgi:hypothetical protein